MCRTNGKSCSVIEDRQEDRYSISTSQTVAHELAHGLSARHDGENNLCNASERYILGSSDAEKTPGTEYNPWLFSPCSVSYITSFLKKTLSSSRGYTCLVYAIEASADIPDVSDKLLGQVIKPDQQCQQFFGNDSFFCRASESRRSITEICQAMLCADVLRGLCIPQIALTGTSCGDGKVCINGHCVSDPYAPQLDENCAFGDRPSNSCSWYINDFIGKCYSTLDYRSCCDTCNNVSRPVKGCEYGDRIIDCTKDHCLNSQVDCCGTCNYGTPFTPTYSTRRSTPKRLATTVNPLVIFTSIKDCKPGDQDLRPELCTNIFVCLILPTQCCHYCSFYYYTSATTSTTTTRPLIPPTSPKTKCEPGDLDLRPEQCLGPSVCKTQPLKCCNFCSLYFKNKSMTTPTIPFTTPTSPK
ncbi:A disintegrin and metalloproteinase with thrombospondin motifs 7, partial [Biomphalaria glabrata]